MASILDSSGPPLCFIVNRSIRQAESDQVKGIEVCRAMEEVCGEGAVVGAQRWYGTWRLYTKTKAARNALLINGLKIRGAIVTASERFPLRSEQDSVKLILGNVPLSVANTEFLKSLRAIGVSPLSDIKDEQYRDEKGGLTSFKTGRRFVYIATPSSPLPLTVKVGGIFNASLYFKNRQENPPRNPPASTIVQGGEGAGGDTGSSDTMALPAGDPICEPRHPSPSLSQGKTLSQLTLDNGTESTPTVTEPAGDTVELRHRSPSVGMSQGKLRQSVLSFNPKIQNINKEGKKKTDTRGRSTSKSKRRTSSEGCSPFEKRVCDRKQSVEGRADGGEKGGRGTAKDWFDLEGTGE